MAKARHLCCERYCRKRRKRGRSRCPRCHSRHWRAADPVYAAFANLKSHAKARRIGFFLTLTEFREFCTRTDYANRKGQSPDSLTVDRVKSDQPYAAGNIQVLTHAENSLKQNRDARWRAAFEKKHGRAWTPVEIEQEEIGEHPFAA